MKTIAALAFALIALAAIFPVDASAQRSNIDRVCFYQDVNFRGWEQCYTAGQEVADLGNRKNAISSIRVFNQAHVIVYDDEDFSGRSAEFRSDIPDLGRVASGSGSWSDRIRSIRISGNFYDDSSRRNPGRGQGQARGQIRDGICVYEHVNYGGYSECWESGQQVRDLGRFGGWNDVISSVRVFGRGVALFYENVGFSGERLAIDRDIPDLGRLRLGGYQSWNDQASSVQVESQFGRNRTLR